MKKLFLIAVALLLSSCLAWGETLPQALWATYGLPINDTPGNTIQENPVIAASGNGYVIAWEDGRAGYLDIYVQKIDESGQALWTTGGLAATQASGNQNFPQIISDDSGGLLVVWQDYREGNSDIFAQKISSAGAPLWGKNGIEICAAEAGQFSPQLVSDGQGGAIITWHDYRSGGGEDIYAQRVSATGSVLWEKDGEPISVATGTQWHPEIVSDGQGGAVICWSDGRVSSANNNIYAQRISPDGVTLWTKDGQAVCQAPNNQERPKLIKTSDGYVVVWHDFRKDNSDVYAQKLSPAGQVVWAADGLDIVASTVKQQNFSLAGDGQDGALVVWEDYTKAEPNIVGQYLRSDGAKVWPEEGRAIGKGNDRQLNPVALLQENGRWLILWENWKNEQCDIYAQQINTNGMLFLPDNGQPVVEAKENQQSMAIAGKQNSAVVVWEDSRQGNFDIFAQKIGANNEMLWGKQGSAICQATGSVIQQNINTIVTNRGEIITVFEDARSGYFNIYAQKVTADGQLVWGAEGLAVAPADNNQSNPVITSDNSGGVIVAFEEKLSSELTTVKAQRISSAGGRAWKNGLDVAQAKAKQIAPAIVQDQAGGAIIIWEDERSELDQKDIYAQHISNQGALQWGNKGEKIISGSGDQTDISAAEDGSGGIILAWTDYRRGDRNPNIYAQRLNSAGQLLWDKDGQEICAAPDIQRKPSLFGDQQGGAIISWTDKGGGSYDIYAQRINSKGESLWMRDGIPVSQISRTQQNPQVSSPSALVWEDYRFGNWDIFASAVSPQGKLLWGSQGVPIVLLPQTQYAPKAIAWKDNGLIVCWEDYRNGKSYEIFTQKLNGYGEPAWTENGVSVKTHNGARSPKVVGNVTNNSFYVLWEDFTNGGRSIFGQRYQAN